MPEAWADPATAPPKPETWPGSHQAEQGEEPSASVARAPGGPRSEHASAEALETPAFARFHWSFLYDGGAVPFFWLPLAGRAALNQWVEPRSSPLFFDPDEGGAESRKAQELPSWVITVSSVAMNAYIGLGDSDESRWFHAKGMAEAMITTALFTTIGKITFGRHRPDYDPNVDDASSRRSFPSGHSANTLSTATYFGLYMRYHGFDRFRTPGTLPWWEGLTYGGLVAASIYVPYTRVRDHRHHVSDVIVGSLLGASSALAFFYWQERRYRAAAGQRVLELERVPLRPIIVPDLGGRTLWLCLRL